MPLRNKAVKSGSSPASGSASSFTARLAVTDGGDPIDLIDDDDGGRVWRADDLVGSGVDLNSAWDDYLYSCYPAAPVYEEELAAMWLRFDGQNDKHSNRGSEL